MNIESKRLITLSFFVAILSVFLVWMGRDQNGAIPGRDPGPPPVRDTDPKADSSIHRARPTDQCGKSKARSGHTGARNTAERLVTTNDDGPIEGVSVTVYVFRHMTTWEYSYPLLFETTGVNGCVEVQLDVGCGRVLKDARVCRLDV